MVSFVRVTVSVLVHERFITYMARPLWVKAFHKIQDSTLAHSICARLMRKKSAQGRFLHQRWPCPNSCASSPSALTQSPCAPAGREECTRTPSLTRPGFFKYVPSPRLRQSEGIARKARPVSALPLRSPRRKSRWFLCSLHPSVPPNLQCAFPASEICRPVSQNKQHKCAHSRMHAYAFAHECARSYARRTCTHRPARMQAWTPKQVLVRMLSLIHVMTFCNTIGSRVKSRLCTHIVAHTRACVCALSLAWRCFRRCFRSRERARPCTAPRARDRGSLLGEERRESRQSDDSKISEVIPTEAFDVFPVDDGGEAVIGGAHTQDSRTAGQLRDWTIVRQIERDSVEMERSIV